MVDFKKCAPKYVDWINDYLKRMNGQVPLTNNVKDIVDTGHIVFDCKVPIEFRSDIITVEDYENLKLLRYFFEYLVGEDEKNEIVLDTGGVFLKMSRRYNSIRTEVVTEAEHLYMVM